MSNIAILDQSRLIQRCEENVWAVLNRLEENSETLKSKLNHMGTLVESPKKHGLDLLRVS